MSFRSVAKEIAALDDRRELAVEVRERDAVGGLRVDPVAAVDRSGVGRRGVGDETRTAER